MAETPTDLLVAGYQDIEEATKDFESLVALVRHEDEKALHEAAAHGAAAHGISA